MKNTLRAILRFLNIYIKVIIWILQNEKEKKKDISLLFYFRIKTNEN